MATSLVPSHARWSFKAGASSLSQYQFVAVNTSDQIIAPAATGVFAVVLDDAPSLAASTTIGSEQTGGAPSGGYVTGTYYGCVLPVGVVQKVIAGASLNPGVAVMTNTSGQAIAAVTGAVTLGWTLKAASSGDIVPIMLNASAHF